MNTRNPDPFMILMNWQVVEYVKVLLMMFTIFCGWLIDEKGPEFRTHPLNDSK